MIGPFLHAYCKQSKLEPTGKEANSVYTLYTQVVDARSSGRFEGSAPEPRPSIPSGHMLGTHNIPFYRMLNPESKIFKCKDELREGTTHFC